MIVITLIAELVGNVTLRVGFGKVVLLPMLWGILIAAAVSVCWRQMPKAIAVSLTDQAAASVITQIAVMPFIAKLALLVGGSIPALLASGWALAFQELGHFLGTALLGMPLALLLGIKREAVGATFSVGREPSLAIVSERYGLNSPEGRGVMAEYVTGSVLGAVFISVVASLMTSLGLFNPLALAMGAGIGSGSMMAAASGAIAAQQTAEVGKQVAAFAAASNLITTTIGTFFTLFISLPFSNFLYRTLEPLLGRWAKPAVATQRETTESGNDVAPASHAPTLSFTMLIGILILLGAISLCLGNWIGFKTSPPDAIVGIAIIVAVAVAGYALKQLLPLKIPSVFWITLIGMFLTSPYWPGAAWVADVTAKVNFLALATPTLCYAGLSLAKDLPAFRVLGWRIVVVSLVANAGTFIFATGVAETLMH